MSHQNEKTINLKGESTAQHNNHQEGISIRTEVVSQETDLGVTPRPDDTNQQELRRNNGDTMSDATSTGNNDSDEVGCSEDLSQPADGYNNEKAS